VVHFIGNRIYEERLLREFHNFTLFIIMLNCHSSMT